MDPPPSFISTRYNVDMYFYINYSSLSLPPKMQEEFLNDSFVVTHHKTYNQQKFINCSKDQLWILGMKATDSGYLTTCGPWQH